MSAMWSVFRKEVKENLRDRRTMISTFVYGPLFGPVLFALMVTFIVKLELSRAEKPLELPVVGAQYAPNFVSWMGSNGIKVLPAPKNPEIAILEKDAEVIVRIAPDFAKDWSAGKPATVEFLMDQSQQKNRQSVERVKRLLETYSNAYGALRLLVRGVDPSVAHALNVEEKDLSTPQSRSGMLLGILPALLIMAVFTGGMYLAIDTTAGERERQSLEPLLANPLPRWQLMGGKLAATTVFALSTLMLSLIAFSLSSRFLPSDKIGMVIKLGAQSCALMFLSVAPLALIGASLQTTVAAFSKGFREAQTYTGMLMMVPYLFSVVLMINPVKQANWMFATPFLSQQLLVEAILKGEPFYAWQIAISAVVSLLVGFVLAALCARLYQRESLAISA
jgi:sodium transport system permease protein